MRLTILLAPLLLLVSPPAWTDGTVYRWKDASGQTHFSQTPPPSGGYDVMRPAPGGSSPPAAAPGAARKAAPPGNDQRAREQRFVEEAEAARRAKAEAQKKERTAKLERAEKCKTARELAQFLEERTARRLVIMADDGNYARMDEDEFLKQLDAAKQEVATHCS
jgi:hypothetical protein